MSLSRAPRRRPVRRVLALTAAAGTASLALAGCGLLGGGDTGGAKQGGSGNDTKFVQGTGQITRVAEADREMAPDISGETVDDKELRLSDYRGKVVVLNVWGSWCAPCRAEAPNLAKVAKDTADQDVQFVGINTRDLDKANARAFDRNYGIEYPSLFDPSGKLILKFPKGSLNPQSIPSTLILDREGRIAARALKALGEKELREALDPVVAEQRAGQ
ncbi:TlpA disulfide reductase family protein [Streptomyces sp. 549]|uniref:TlpA family protein disulfide reductase n=1 Tax=Streptomyces sp. 549 TaxID=3049076 RepID=UPI0024C3F21B|nr:TlpA disulfide reductase family protein [Streptomyces sp. 549]MDK1475363.1 TlpA disulfide reductase family protein [Streptomyces sp. 549]